MIPIFRKVQQRYVVVTMMFLSMTITFFLRMNFPIVLTQMVYVPNANQSSNSPTISNSELICPVKDRINDTNNVTEIEQNASFTNNSTERYQWSQKVQGLVLSSFYIGNIFAEIPSSMLVQRVGPKLMLLISIALSAIVTVFTPLSTQYGGIYGLIATRIVLGVVQGPVFPSFSAFIVPWYPIEERTRLCSIGYIGVAAGGALASLVSGMLIHHTGRWDVVFYFTTVVLIIWWILFSLICFEQPESHPFIGDSEKEYLRRKVEDYENERKNLPPTPWLAIIKSAPFLTLILSTGLYSWSFYIINNDLPKYLNDVLHVSFEENSIYSSVPKVLSIIVSTGSGFLCDFMLTTCHFDRTNVRKVFVVLTSIVPATFLICASYAGCNELLAVFFLTISISGHGFNSAGAAINIFDLSPNYIAPLNGVINRMARNCYC